MTRRPNSSSTEIPPITAPAMRPGDGEEPLDEVAEADDDVVCAMD
jgi:hypothetical protein